MFSGGLERELIKKNCVNENLPSKNLENLKPTKVNTEVWKKNYHKTKSFDIQQQQFLQSYIFEKIIFTAKGLDKYFQDKKDKQTDWPKEKYCIILCIL